MIAGFDKANEKHTSINLLITGYAYEGDGEVQLMQKQYEADKNVNSPYACKVTRGDDVLYAVTINTVETMTPFLSTIKEYEKPTVTE